MNWLQQLLLAVLRNVYVNGVLQQFVPGINFGSGLAVTINAPLGYATVTASASTVPVAAVAVSSSGNIASPSTNAVYNITSSADVTLTVTGTPVDGVELTFVDYNKTWATYPFTFTSQAGGVVRNAGNLAATDALSATFNLTGASVKVKWNATGGIWTSL